MRNFSWPSFGRHAGSFVVAIICIAMLLAMGLGAYHQIESNIRDSHAEREASLKGNGMIHVSFEFDNRSDIVGWYKKEDINKIQQALVDKSSACVFIQGKDINNFGTAFWIDASHVTKIEEK